MSYVWDAVGESGAVVSGSLLWFDGVMAAGVFAIALAVAATLVLLAGLAGRRVVEELSPFPGGPSIAWPSENTDEENVLVQP